MGAISYGGRAPRRGCRKLIEIVVRVTVAVLLLAAALPAQAQESGGVPPSAMPPEPLFPELPVRRGRCPVAPDPQWTAPETWAWERICIGSVADLSERAGRDAAFPYQFDSWPRHERRLSTAFLYQVLTEPKYAEAVTFRGVRISSAWFPELVDLGHLSFDKPLQLTRSVFSEPLVLSRYRSKSEVDLGESRFDYRPPEETPGKVYDAPYFSLDLLQAEIGQSLGLRRIEAGDVMLNDVVIGQHLLLDDMTLYGPLTMNGAKIGGMLWLRNAQLDIGLEARSLEVGKDVEIVRTVVGTPAWDQQAGQPDWSKLTPGYIEMSNARIHGNILTGYGSRVPMPLELDQIAQKQLAQTQVPPTSPGPNGLAGASGPEPRRDPRFTNPEIGFIVGTLVLAAAEIDGEIQLRDSDVQQYLNLEDAQIGGDLWLTRGRIVDNNLSAIRVGGFLLLQHTLFQAGLFIDSGEIGRHITMSSETRITGPLYMPNLTAHGSLYADGAKVDGPATLRGAALDGDLLLIRGTTFEGGIDASFMRIGGSIDFNGGRFKSVDLTGAGIGAELRLTAGRSTAQFAGDSLLNLSNAQAGSLQDVTGVWPDNLQLVGFNYQRLGGSPTAATAAAQPAATAPAAAAPGPDPDSCHQRLAADAATGSGEAGPYDAEKLLCWLSGQKRFSPAPYAHLAEVLRQSGEKEIADEIIFGGKMRQWSETSVWVNPRFLLPWAFTGFGVYPYVAGIWVVALIAAGTVIFGLDPSPEIRRFSLTQRIIYSLDMLIPAVHLRHHHAEIELQSWPRYYLYGHKLMGYVLLTFLAAALLGVGGLE